MKKIDRRSFLKNPLKACSLKHSNALSNKNEIIMFNRRNFLSTSVTGFLAWVLSKRSEAQLIPFGFWKKKTPPTYVDDVFSTYLYTGNGGTQTITNGIDLAGTGGLVIAKRRNAATDWDWHDSTMPDSNYLSSNQTYQRQTGAANKNIINFTSSGFNLGPADNMDVNLSGGDYVSWTFCKSAKFFDVVTYTGNGLSAREVAHSLGVTPGMIVVKCTSAAGDWWTYHNGMSNGWMLQLNTSSSGNSGALGSWYVYPCTSAGSGSSTVFTVGYGGQGIPQVNANGATYVAYLFAHDTTASGMIQCGSVTVASANGVVNLGFEPQYVLYRQSDAAGSWCNIDSMRGLTSNIVANNSRIFYANVTNAEQTNNGPALTSSGFVLPYDSGNSHGNGTYIYMAIRRSNKPPTLGTQVYNAAYTIAAANNADRVVSGFPVDLVLFNVSGSAPSIAIEMYAYDRIRSKSNAIYSAAAEVNNPYALEKVFDSNTGLVNRSGVSIAAPTNNYINYMFRRAPGFMDVVCYTGTGAAHTEAHNLGAVPELMIVKNRGDGAGAWTVYSAALGAGNYLIQNTSAAVGGSGSDTARWNGTPPTSSVFSVGSADSTNRSTYALVAYLFVTKAGISKVGSYIGDGASKTINCGFTGGARFILIKRTDSAGDWYVWDTARGIAIGNDPHLALNSAAAEVTNDDSIDPHASGFIVKQVAATNVNVTSATYIFLAIA